MRDIGTNSQPLVDWVCSAWGCRRRSISVRVSYTMTLHHLHEYVMSCPQPRYEFANRKRRGEPKQYELGTPHHLELLAVRVAQPRRLVRAEQVPVTVGLHSLSTHKTPTTKTKEHMVHQFQGTQGTMYKIYTNTPIVYHTYRIACI